MTKIGNNKDLQSQIPNSDKRSDNCVFFLKNLRYNIADVFWVVLS